MSPTEALWGSLAKRASESWEFILPHLSEWLLKPPNCKSRPGLYKLCIAQNTPACWFTGLTPTTAYILDHQSGLSKGSCVIRSWITYLWIRIRNIRVKVAELFNANVHFLIVFLDILDAGLYLINLRIFFKESSSARTYFCCISARIRVLQPVA